MGITRRQFLRYGTVSTVGAVSAVSAVSIVSIVSIVSKYASILAGKNIFDDKQATLKNTPTITSISASSNSIGEYFLTATDNQHNIVYQQQLPYRGHAIAVSHRHQRLFCICRRPENVISVISFKGKLLEHVAIPTGRHLYGHAVCDNDGTHLYTTENNIDDGSGKIGVWQVNNQAAQTTQLVATFSSYGIGPHDIALSPDQQYIIVANGGIHTHPQSGRKKLNIATMSPSLVFIHRISGKLYKRLILPSRYRHNSIRHLTTDTQGNVFIALQNQLKNNPHEVLLARYDKIKDALIPFIIPKSITPTLQGYIGSIALDSSQTILAATSPRGNCAMFFTLSGDFLYHLENHDVCGVQAGEKAGEFILSNGNGEFMHCLVKDTLTVLSKQHYQNTHWDNHLTQL